MTTVNDYVRHFGLYDEISHQRKSAKCYDWYPKNYEKKLYWS